jgi:glyoxylase-like metal-dependent hydrolase (beta-lactamase superfamily II)
MRSTTVLLLSVLTLAVTPAQAQTRTTLDIYVVDVEGGNAVLFVPPSGQAVLIDSGNGGPGAVRDAERIMTAIRAAGVRQIEHLVTTHYHGDHVGGISELASRIPIANYVDHGPNVQPGPNIDPVLQQYAQLYAKAKRTIVKPGDKLPVSGLDWTIVTAAGEVIKTTPAGAGAPNPSCAAFRPQGADRSENAQSVGVLSPSGNFVLFILAI